MNAKVQSCMENHSDNTLLFLPNFLLVMNVFKHATINQVTNILP